MIGWLMEPETVPRVMVVCFYLGVLLCLLTIAGWLL